MPEIKNISHRHDQIMDWLIANPALPLSACAAEFGVTQPWLSCIIHSDLFQAELKRRQQEVFGEVALTVKDRITALAHDSLRRLHEKVIVEERLDLLTDTADLALKALGFGPQPGRPAMVQVNVNQPMTVSKDVLAEARARMEGRVVALPSPGSPPAQVPTSIETAVAIGDE